ncbi:MAG: MFS transporter [Anaerolineaceae bacterium]
MPVNLLRWFSNPNVPPNVDRKNFIYVQIDAIGIGLANAASPFLPVFITRLGGTNIEVSLLTSMPAMTGLIFALIAGRMLQRQRNVVPWFSFARLLVVSSYALTGIVPFFFDGDQLISAILIIWAAATLPQTIVAICFSVVMNAVAGPASRFELMTRRWSIMGVTTSTMIILVGQVLNRLGFPFNYQIVFMVLSIGGLLSYIFSSRIRIPDNPPTFQTVSGPLAVRIRAYFESIWSNKPFRSFILKRFVFLTGFSFAAPLFPLYYVREVQASDAWISAYTMAASVSLIVGYFFWSNQSRRHGSHSVLLWTTLGASLYPALLALTTQDWLIILISVFSGIFQSGVDLIFFDELMRRIPDDRSAVFVSFAQSLQYLSTIFSPIIGSTLANYIGLPAALFISAAIRISAFLLFFIEQRAKKPIIDRAVSV